MLQVSLLERVELENLSGLVVLMGASLNPVHLCGADRHTLGVVFTPSVLFLHPQGVLSLPDVQRGHGQAYQTHHPWLQGHPHRDRGHRSYHRQGRQHLHLAGVFSMSSRAYTIR